MLLPIFADILQKGLFLLRELSSAFFGFFVFRGRWEKLGEILLELV
jgi:hypothetical protein